MNEYSIDKRAEHCGFLIIKEFTFNSKQISVV